MKKALETIKKHIKDLERMVDIFSFYGCFSSAVECKKAIKELTEAINEIEAQKAKISKITKECTSKIYLFNKQMDELDDCDERYIRRDAAIDSYKRILAIVKDTK